jgi:rubrerythrin
MMRKEYTAQEYADAVWEAEKAMDDACAKIKAKYLPDPRTCPWCGAITDQCPSCERPAPEPMPQYDGPLPELGAEEETT